MAHVLKGSVPRKLIPPGTKVMVAGRPGRWIVTPHKPVRVSEESLYCLRRIEPAPRLDMWVSDKEIQILDNRR